MKLGDQIKEGFATDLEQEAARKVIRAIEKWRKGGRIKTAQERWLFELVQNALDIAKERHNGELKIELGVNSNSVMFKHNAGYFTPQEIRALIYAYSTKPYDRESELAGKFATGFLVTHIVSERVKIKGILCKDGENFQFSTLVNRTSDKISDVCESFQNSFNQLDSATKEGIATEYWTEYTYEATDNVGEEAINIGITEFEKHLPFILAFNKLSGVTINGKVFTKEEAANENILVENVGCTQVYIKKGKDSEVAILAGLNDAKIIGLSNRPKIYVKGLPLIETAHISIPFVIHSTRFETTEDRDTLTNTEENIEILKEAFTLYSGLVDYISKCPEPKMGSFYHLLEFQTIEEEKISQNPLWDNINRMMHETVKVISEDVLLVDTFEGRRNITNVIFPRTSFRSANLQEELFINFYDLLATIKKNIPTPSELHSWINVASQLKGEFSDITNIELYGIGDMKKELERFVIARREKEDTYPSLHKLNDEYNLPDSKQFLFSFFELVNNLYKQEIIESEKFADCLLIDQSGIVGPLNWKNGRLYIDEVISEEFKDTASRIGWDIRQELLDKDFASFDIIRDLVHDSIDLEKALEVLIEKYKLEEEVNGEGEWSDNISGWIELFAWCVANKKLCKDFPIITKDGKTRQIEDLNVEAFLNPFNRMGVVRNFEDIYPENRILHNKYFDRESVQDFIKGLESYSTFVTKLPIYKKNITLAHNKLQCILEEKKEISKVDHKLVSNADPISILPFWNEIIGRISEYDERAKLLFKFVIEYLINMDQSWEKHLTVNCSCKDKQHVMIRSQWLASLKADAWVPYHTIEDEEDKIVKREASKESIEKLFSPDELDQLIITNPGKITRLLTHFGFDELDLKIKLQSIEMSKPEYFVRREVSRLVDITNIIPDLPDLFDRDIDAFKEFVEKLKNEYENRSIKSENKKIGENVERIIRAILKKKGFKVEVIYKGGDMEVWPRNEGWDSGEIEIGPYILEIKFTSGGRVHLSKAQSEMARNKKENYIILVVENDGSMRDKLKTDIEEKNVPNDLIAIISENSHIIQNIHAKLGDIPNPDEVEPDIYGYWVKRKLWDDADDIMKWSKQIFHTQI